MANHSTPETKDISNEPPAPELLKSQSDDGSSAPEVSQAAASTSRVATKLRRATYRPSHKATFVGLAAVVTILAINAVIIAFVIKGQGTASADSSQSAVTISPAVLNKVGVSQNTVGNAGSELVVGPDSHFNGKVTVASSVNVAGQLTLNSKLSGTDASLTTLEAAKGSLGELNVNGDGTISSLNLRKDLNVAGLTQLQGLTVSQLLTVNNNVNVAGSLAVGGTLSARGFHASSLISDTTLTIGGHIISSGLVPSVVRGSALRGTDTVSISGNDAAGTVAVNVGAGSTGAGCVAQIAFRNQYTNTPHVVITAVGPAGSVYVSRSVGGFSICVNSPLSQNGYAFDYIVIQ